MELINQIFVRSQKDFIPLPKHIDKSNTLFYPEASMTTNDLLYSGRPQGYNVVTDSHFLVCLYSRNDVWVYDKELKEWVNPEYQTYGASFSFLLQIIWGYDNSISQAVIDGNITNVMGHKIKK